MFLCCILAAVEGKLIFATQAECPKIDSKCSSQVEIASRIVEPICTSGTELDRSLNVCFSSCSKFSSTFTKFSVYSKDPSSCLPSCPMGYTFIGVKDEKAQCAKCPDSSFTLRKNLESKSSEDTWRCSQAGLPTSKPAIRTRSLLDRPYKASFCPEGAYTDSEGICHACGAVATPASIEAGAPEAGPFTDGIDTEDTEIYAIVFDAAVSGRETPVCVLEECCNTPSAEYTGEDEKVENDYTDYEGDLYDDDEEDVYPVDDADFPNIDAVSDDGSIGDDSIQGEDASDVDSIPEAESSDATAPDTST
ncbi:hypothetical protein Ndes2526A_g02550 [Nannochloris sp. 'desiccata']